MQKGEDEIVLGLEAKSTKIGFLSAPSFLEAQTLPNITLWRVWQGLARYSKMNIELGGVMICDSSNTVVRSRRPKKPSP